MGGYIGAKTGTLVASASDIRGDISATDTTPEIVLKNTTETDADGTRSGKITFKGEQSGGEESVLAQIQGSHDGASDDEKGDLIFKTNDGNDALAPTERLRINSAGDVLVSSPDPSLTITNTTEEDSDGGREGTIVFKGEQSGGELSTLAEIEASHDGTADDEKGDLIFKTNDGSDGASPTEALRIDSEQNVGIGTDVPSGKLTIAETSGANAPTTITSKNSYLHLGSNDFGASNNGKFMMGFGYTEGQVNTNSPAYIGFEETSTSGDTKGALTFHTRDVVTDTAPTEHMRIHTGGEITTPANPAFYVYNSSVQTSSNANEKIVLNTEDLDRGGNFDNGSSYSFTAPVTGVYNFTGKFLTPSATAQTTIYIKVGSTPVSYSRSALTATACHRTFNVNWMGTVTAGTEVAVYISDAGESIYGDSSGDWSHFQGFLVG